jgi:serine/threonine protein kinase
MPPEFHYEYLVRLPLPLAQLYSRAYNAKDPRSRHDNAFYLFEVLVKLMAAPLVAAYVHGVRHDVPRVASLDRLLVQLALPSLGQWVSIVRELARHFGDSPEAACHPLGHVWGQLTRRHRDRPGLLGLYQRIKNGPDGERASEQSCTVLQIFEALVQYRNAVFGHGAGRLASFYEQHMGPLLFPAVNDILSADVLSPLGPPGTRLVYLYSKPQAVSAEAMQIELWDLIGMTGVTAPPVRINWEAAREFTSPGVAVLWPEQPVPLRLDPLLMCRERDTDQVPEVLFLNRDRNARQVEYLSYTTGRTERDETMVPAMARLLGLIADRTITEEELAALGEQSIVETPSVEALWEPQAEPLHQLGDYELLAEIGRGGMGVVYLARQLSLGRVVALKVLPTDLALDAVALARFQREIRALANCDHPNVVKVLTSGTLPDGRPYYTMEYVPGADLEQVWRELAGQGRQDGASHLGNSVFVRAVISASGKRRQETEARYTSSAGSGTGRPAASTSRSTADTGAVSQAAEISVPRLSLPPLPPLPSAEDDPGGYVRRVATLMCDAALALQSVHDQQIIHRDVKPANLMLTPDSSRVVVMDFGLAKGPETTLAASRQGGLLGTMRYAAPEQLAAANLKVGPAADVRGLGVTMWELLTRRRLFADAQDEKQLAMMIHEMDVPRLRTIDPSFDRDLDAIVARATERRTTDRIATAGQLAQYLQLYLDGQPLPIRPPSRIELLRRWVRSHKGTVATGCAVILLLIAAASGVWYWYAYSRTHIQYYAFAVDRWGAMEGVKRVTPKVAQHRASTYKFFRRGRYGSVEKVELVNGLGKCPSANLGFVQATYIIDKPITSNESVPCLFIYERNAEGHVINAKVYEQDGRLLYETEHDPNRNIAHYKSEGGFARALVGSGAAYVKFTRAETGPEVGAVKEIRYFDQTGTSQPDYEGTFGVRYEFDTRGLPIQATFLGSSGEVGLINSLGVSHVKIAYNEDGTPTAVAFLDTENKPTLSKLGFAKKVFSYDTFGNITEEAFVDLEDHLIVSEEAGYAKASLAYGARGNVVAVAFFGADGKPMLHKAYGCAKITMKYDDRGNRTEEAFYGPDDKLVLHEKHGYAKATAKYDERGNKIEEAVFGPDGKLMLHEEHGYAKGTAKYDDRGNKIEEAAFGPDGQPVVHKDSGCAKQSWKYDAHNNKIESVCLGVDGAPTANKHGYARYTATYGEQEAMRSCSYTDASGHPVKLQGQVVIVEVFKNGQAERLSLQAGDVITAYNQMPINTFCELRIAVDALGDGPQTLTIARAGQTLTFQVQPGKLGIRIEEGAATISLPTNDAAATPQPAAP